MLKWNTWLKQNSKRKLTGYLALGNPLGQHGRRIQHWHWIRCTLVRGLQSLWSSTENTHKSFKNKMRCVKMTTGHLCTWIKRVNRKKQRAWAYQVIGLLLQRGLFSFWMDWVKYIPLLVKKVCANNYPMAIMNNCEKELQKTKERQKGTQNM